ncbi:hypothetical protein ERX46_16645 [Brumimicrobium glaciale]|uniref:DUF7793 domain-containing protein n=1 Tax=Brumimicrobium glaciale TaxID=200475 RepID=A0A4Q4KF71_9FLAO|nr:hypothetical protein [Brumimicrobium glaciale]RYM31310.1 hypothetical protein ERX46_16645 [Brumimicrobium glaciale]
MLNKIEYDSPVARITIDNEGIFIFKLKDTSSIYDIEEARSQYRFMNLHSEGKPYKAIIDTRGSLVLPTDAACDYYFEGNNFENIMALVVNSLPMKLLLGRMFRHENVPNSKIFKNDEDAYEWLLKKEF